MRLIHAARLSQKARGHEQTGIDSSDLEAQRWAGERGHEIVATVADTRSGTTHMWARPNLKPWVTEPDKMVQYDGILAYKSDRLSRAAWADEVQIRLWAREHGKHLYIVSPSLHWPPDNHAEQISWEIFASQAHEEWRNTSERYRRMQGYLKSQGRLIGRPPFGYDVVPAEGGHKTIVPNELGRKYVPEIFARCIAGDSTRTIAHWLDAEGVKPANSASWNTNSVRKIILSPTYTGRRAEQDKKTGEFGRVILRCEPLVDRATWRRAGEALSNRPKRGPMHVKGKALLSGVLFCANCGGPMYRNQASTRPTKKPYYVCVGVYPRRKSECKFLVPVESLDAAVGGYMAVHHDPIMQMEVVPGNDWSDELEEVEQQIIDLLNEDADDFVARMAELHSRRKELRDRAPEPDRVEELPVGETYAQRWARLSDQERGAWLRSSDVRIHASRDLAKLVQVHAPTRSTVSQFPPGLIEASEGVWAIVTIDRLRTG